MPSNSATLTEGLNTAAEILRGSAVAIVSQRGPGGYPEEIAQGMRIDQAEVQDNQGSITISEYNIGDKENKAITLAFELGSGLTGPRGQRYPITPVNASMLAFFWPEASNIVGRKGVPTTPLKKIRDGEYTGGKAFFPKVMHPGIRPRPFLQRALDNVLPLMSEILGDSFDALILPDVPRMEVVE